MKALSVTFGTTPIAGAMNQASSSVRTMVIEGLLVVIAIASLLPAFAMLAMHASGRDGRFADAIVGVSHLPGPVLPSVCATLSGRVDERLRDRLCGSRKAARVDPVRIEDLPRAVIDVRAHLRQALQAPLVAADARLADLRQAQREGAGDPDVLRESITSAEAQIQQYATRFAIAPAADAEPPALACAFEGARAALAPPAPNPGSDGDAARANTVMLLAAALDGHPAAAVLARTTTIEHAVPSRRCADMGPVDALARVAALTSDARAAATSDAKNAAMRALLRTSGWQWAGWMLAALLLLQLSRRAGLAARGIAIALIVAAVAAWLGRVPLPLAADHAFVLGRESTSLLSMPAPFVLALAAAGVLLLLCAPWLSNALATGAQRPSSAFAYPGLVFATGIGWLVLLDLSANGHPSNRYLALYHQGHLWAGMLAFSVVAFARQPIGRALSWALSMLDGGASRVAARCGAVGGAAILIAVLIVLIGLVGSLLLNVRQLTSELGRLWLIVGAAWFFFLRGTPFTERLSRSGTSIGSLARYVWPLLFVVAVLIGAMLVTHDMGPLLIAGYGAGAFVAASVAMWWYQRRGTAGLAYGVAVAVFAAWIVVTTGALFRLGSLDDVGAARLESLAAPLASANDQLALVTWFQRASPPAGFRLGTAPWCGFGGAGTCAGVPVQIQSDYTFTALVGEFGWSAAWAFTIGCVIWLHSMVRGHAAATRGEPRFIRAGARIRNDEQAFLSWICVTWVVLTMCQLAVTVAGNIAVIPLTGVPFPFVSFGMTSLVLNAAMLGLAINVNATSGDAHG
jgi:cell division protein FtsW (lipid II flippase)